MKVLTWKFLNLLRSSTVPQNTWRKGKTGEENQLEDLFKVSSDKVGNYP